MTMDRRRMMLWAIFAVSTIFSVYSIWSARSSAPTAVAAGQPAPAAPGAETSAAPVPVAPPLPAAELAGWQATLPPTPRDPFFTTAEIEAMTRGPVRLDAPPPVAPPALPPPLPEHTVKMVLGTGTGMRALVGNEVVKVGDMLGDERVVDISPNSVVLEHEGERRELPLAGRAPPLDTIRLERTR